MKLIVGLGNPGAKYQLTRHNIGFMVIDALAKEGGARGFRQEHRADTAKLQIDGATLLLAKPQTYMNLSGESVRPLLDFYKIELKDLLVIHDDIDQPFGRLRFQVKRGHGGHNGIRSLHQHLGTDDYARLKLGVDRPTHPGFEVADYVLSPFSREEMATLPKFLGQAAEAVLYFANKGVERAANRYNSAAMTEK